MRRAGGHARIACAIACAIGLEACASVEVEPMRHDARVGAAGGRKLTRVVALPATCGSLQADFGVDVTAPAQGAFERNRAVAACAPDALVGVDQLVRSGLDFGGFQVIDAERVNAVTAARHEIVERHEVKTGRFSTDRRETRVVETRGALFDDATPREQAEILKELGAEGVVSARVWFSVGNGTANRHDVAVQVVLSATADRAMAWARRCTLEISAEGEAQALEKLARCATEGVHP